MQNLLSGWHALRHLLYLFYHVHFHVEGRHKRNWSFYKYKQTPDRRWAFTGLLMVLLTFPWHINSDGQISWRFTLGVNESRPAGQIGPVFENTFIETVSSIYGCIYVLAMTVFMLPWEEVSSYNGECTVSEA